MLSFDVHSWVQKADLQPLDDAYPDHIAVDETVIQLNDKRFRLYAAIDPRTNRMLHISSLRREIKRLPRCSLLNSVTNISSMTRSFSSILHRGRNLPSIDTVSIPNTKNTVIGTGRTCFLKFKTSNQPVLKLFRSCRSRYCRELASCVRLHTESTYLNTTRNRSATRTPGERCVLSPREIREHFQSSHGLYTSGQSGRTALSIPGGSSKREYDREHDDEDAGTDHSSYLSIVSAIGSFRQEPPRSKQCSAPDYHRPDYRFNHVDYERLKRERKDR